MISIKSLGLYKVTSLCVHTDGFVCFLLFYAIVTVFQLYHGGNMMYEMRRKKREEMAFDDAVSYTQQAHGL